MIYEAGAFVGLYVTAGSLQDMLRLVGSNSRACTSAGQNVKFEAWCLIRQAEICSATAELTFLLDKATSEAQAFVEL